MTRFELDENFNSRNSTEQNATHAALLEAGFMQVADKKHQQGDKPATQPAAKSEENTPAEKTLQKAVEAFQKTPNDAAAGLKASSPLFEQAISQADKDFQTMTKDVEAKAKELAPKAQLENAKVAEATEKAVAGLQSVPENDQKKAEALAQAYMALDKNDPFRAQLEKRMSAWPQFGAAVKEMGHLDTPALDAMGKLEEKFNNALADRVGARMTYAEALAAAGKTEEAQKQMSDAKKILGVPDDEGKGRPIGNGPRMWTA